MNIQYYDTNNKHFFAPLAAAIQRSIKSATTEYSYLVPRGWQLVVKMHSDDETFFDLHLREKLGGSYAEAKMNVLEMFPKRAHTGADQTNDILHMLKDLDLDGSINAEEICQLESPDQMSKQQREWLRDECNLTSMYGGIRIPYEYLVNSDEPHTETGEILLAFSGASQEQDLFMDLWVFQDIKNFLCETQKHIQHTFNLAELREDPTIHFWLQLLRIREYDQ